MHSSAPLFDLGSSLVWFSALEHFSVAPPEILVPVGYPGRLVA